MPPPRDSVTHWPINWQSALIPSSSQELFFLVPFGSPADREQLHPLLLILLGTPPLKNTLLLASHTLPTNQGPTYRPATQKGHFLTFTPATIINLSLLCCLKEVSLFICVAKRVLPRQKETEIQTETPSRSLVGHAKQKVYEMTNEEYKCNKTVFTNE